jgi:hypothetical protein
MAHGGGARPVLDRAGAGAGRLPTAKREGAPAPLRAVPPRDAFAELDCIRDRLPPAAVAAAERRAIEVGVGADRVLVAAGIVTEDAYAHALAASLGLEFETFEGATRDSCPLDDGRLIEAAHSGLLPLIIGGAPTVVVAPRSARHFVDYVRAHPRVRFRITGAARLNHFIATIGAQALGRRAADALDDAWPQLSAATGSRRLRIGIALTLALVAGAALTAPPAALETLEALLAAGFLAWLALRILGSFLQPAPPQAMPRHDRALPVYTVIAALYREGEAVEGLIEAIRRLDYPGIMAQTPQAA